jgi:hypothetical protein
MRTLVLAALSVIAVTAWPAVTAAQTMAFKLLPRYSYAMFETDARYLDTAVEANRWVAFEVQGAELAGPLESGKPTPAMIRGLLTVKQKPVERVVDATVTYIKLSPDRWKRRSA